MGSAMTAVITLAVDELELATVDLDFAVEGFKGLGVAISDQAEFILGYYQFAFLNWKEMSGNDPLNHTK